MNTPDPFVDAYVAGLNLVALHLSVTASGAAIGLSPLAGVVPCQSVILHCKRHRNIDRLMEVIRSEFENVPAPVALSQLVSAVLNFAGTLGLTILTETEVRTAAAEAIAKMETELVQLQCGSGLSAINRSVRRDAATAQVSYAAIFLWLDNFGWFTARVRKGRWRNHLATLRRVGMAALSVTVAFIRPRLADTLDLLGECVSRWVKHGERLAVGVRLHLWASMAHRRTEPKRRVVPRRQLGHTAGTTSRPRSR
jgi:hypothetical protein